VRAAADAAFRIVARNSGLPGSNNDNPYWFEVEGLYGNNPTLPLSPGARVTVQFVNAGSVRHSFTIGDPIDVSTGLIPPNATSELSFVVPFNASTATAYYCIAHRVIGMMGPIDFGQGTGAAPVAAEEAPALIPASSTFGAVGALVAAALLGGRRR
jgi:plastocyanin